MNTTSFFSASTSEITVLKFGTDTPVSIQEIVF
ncbi:hypothetical protein LMOSLCC5850_0299 [Listeria monocytogenes SLCC5850]|nr:hypothetical protein LMOSLCC5850_0299 [Listeria monocytogenes SLCC5850]